VSGFDSTFSVNRADLVRYAGASGDFNPIHWSESHARGVGLDDVIAHGMLTLARVTMAVTDWVGDPGAVRQIKTRFTRAVTVADGSSAEVAVRGAVLETEDRADNSVALDVSVSCEGADVLSGTRVVLSRVAPSPAVVFVDEPRAGRPGLAGRDADEVRHD